MASLSKASRISVYEFYLCDKNIATRLLDHKYRANIRIGCSGAEHNLTISARLQTVERNIYVLVNHSLDRNAQIQLTSDLKFRTILGPFRAFQPHTVGTHIHNKNRTELGAFQMINKRRLFSTINALGFLVGERTATPGVHDNDLGNSVYIVECRANTENTTWIRQQTELAQPLWRTFLRYVQIRSRMQPLILTHNVIHLKYVPKGAFIPRYLAISNNMVLKTAFNRYIDFDSPRCAEMLALQVEALLYLVSQMSNDSVGLLTCGSSGFGGAQRHLKHHRRTQTCNNQMQKVMSLWAGAVCSNRPVQFSQLFRHRLSHRARLHTIQLKSSTNNTMTNPFLELISVVLPQRWFPGDFQLAACTHKRKL